MNSPSSVSTAQEFVKGIAVRTRDEHGRQAHAFSKLEHEAFAFAENQARNILKKNGLAEGRDFRVDTDAIGNLLVTVYGADRSKTVMAGSHLDSVKNGGNHDGVDGVASALAYLESFARSPRKGSNYTFTVFRSEESSPMTGEACLGSKVMTGVIPESRLSSVSYGLHRDAKILLSDHEFFKDGRWEKVLEERSKPWVRQGTLYLPGNPESGDEHDMEVIAYDELHIEQSRVLYDGGYNAGIVSHIGGSTNRKFTLDSAHLPYGIEETFNSPRTVWTITFLGTEAHTGGTPHNTQANKASDSRWHREDALIGACAFVQELLKHPEARISVSSLNIPAETGFTTVPAIQSVTLHAPLRDASRAFQIIKRIAEQTCNTKGVRYTSTQTVESTRPVTSLAPESLGKFVNVPLIVEESARLISRRVASVFGGDVRGTITDASMDECGVRMNFNTRDINPAKRDELIETVRRQIGQIGLDDEAFFKAATAVTEHIPLDGEVIGIAEEEAWELGLRTITMPSQPSHDAACMQKAGVRTGMVFENHPGQSHIPTEIVGDDEQRDGIMLHHAILDRFTHGDPKSGKRLRKLR